MYITRTRKPEPGYLNLSNKWLNRLKIHMRYADGNRVETLRF
jgi:hypothetical protein